MDKKIKEEYLEIGEKILQGMKLTFEKLVKETAKNDGELVFSENGKIVHIKARDWRK